MAREDAQFSIIYDGEALDEGSIDAKELAPALLALAEVIEEAQPLIPEINGASRCAYARTSSAAPSRSTSSLPSSTSSFASFSRARTRALSPISSRSSASPVLSASLAFSSSSRSRRVERRVRSRLSAASGSRLSSKAIPTRSKRTHAAGASFRIYVCGRRSSK